MSVILGMEGIFVKTNCYLVPRIVSFDTAGKHLLYFLFSILRPYLSKDIEIDRIHIISH